MSPTSRMSLYQIRMEGWKALTKRLCGPSTLILINTSRQHGEEASGA